MSEIEEIKRDGAVPQKNSGRGKHEKGDATLGSFLLDYKEYSEGFTVSRSTWAKLFTDAWKVKKLPAFRLVLGPPNESKKLRLWVFDDATGREMMKLYEEKYGEQS